MSRSGFGLVSLVLLCAMAAGCSDDGSDETAPVPSASPTSTDTPSGSGPCEQVTDEALTEATGVDQAILGPVSEGAFTECRTGFDERGMTIQWDLTEDTSSFADVGEEAEIRGLTRREISVGDTPAWLVQGTVADTDTVRIVLLVDGLKLSVDANDAASSTATVTTQQLLRGAEAVASAYAG